MLRKVGLVYVKMTRKACGEAWDNYGEVLGTMIHIQPCADCVQGGILYAVIYGYFSHPPHDNIHLRPRQKI